MNKLSIIAAVLVLSLFACAGRTPQPVAVVQAKDTTMDCAAIQADIPGNTTHAAELGSEKVAASRRASRLVSPGVSIPVLWFAMTSRGAAGTETRGDRGP